MGERRQERNVRNVRQVQRVAAYAVILRVLPGGDGPEILLSRLAERLTAKELWTLPGGGVEHGENPHDAVVREVHEETGLAVTIGSTAHVYSFHQRDTWRQGRRADAHSLRLVFDGWVGTDSPEPRVVEVDGSTMDAAWKPLADVVDETVPTVALVNEVLGEHPPFRMQRVAAYALAVREGPDGEEVLLTRISARGHHAGFWTLPGGGVDHGEDPRDAVVREVAEECSLTVTVGEALEVHHTHFGGTAPSGRFEDFHGIHLVFAVEAATGSQPAGAATAATAASAAEATAASAADMIGEATAASAADLIGAATAASAADLIGEATAASAADLIGEATGEPSVADVGGTTDAVAWVPVRDVETGVPPVLDVVRAALEARRRRLRA